MRLVFLDNRRDVSTAATSIAPSGDVKFIALTAEAAQYLEELQIVYEPVSAYADTGEMDDSIYDQFNVESYGLAKEIESFIAQYYQGAQFENPGFLSGLSYYLQYSVNIILMQSFLMRETIRACSPDVVTVFDAGMDPWFADNGYEHLPWFDVIEDLSRRQGFQFEILPLPDPDTANNEAMKNQWQARNDFISRVKSRLRKNSVIKNLLFRRKLNTSPRLKKQDAIEGLEGLRLLMVQSYSIDWAPILSALSYLKGSECYYIEGVKHGKHSWAYYYESFVYHLWHLSGHCLRIDPPQIDKEEKRLLSELFDSWLRKRSQPELNVFGMNLFPALINHLRTMVSLGPALARHADSYAAQILDKIKPHVVCFVAIINMADQRLAFQCRKKNIPVVCYQHGGGFGVMHCAKDEQTEVAHADYFLTHGKLVQPRDKPAFPIRARYIPVGSTRIESMIKDTQRRIAKKTGLINILWIAETSTRNRLSVPFTLEDTERYLIQKKGLEILAGAKHLRVIFRPVRATLPWEGTTRWLNNTRLSSIKVDVKKPLQDLIHGSDIIISSTASPTTWEEVIGLKKPMILFTKAPMSSYADYFIRDLQKSCLWCRSEQSLYIALRRLVSEGTDFIADLQQLDTTDFIRNYVLYEDDGRCVQRVLSVLKTVCQKN